MRPINAEELRAVVSSMLGLPESADEALGARIKHMQRLGFPAAEVVGTGRRRKYAFADIVRICLAFQLVDVGMPSALAVTILQDGWNDIVPALKKAGAMRDAPMLEIIVAALARGYGGPVGFGAPRPSSGNSIRSVAAAGSPKLAASPCVRIDPVAFLNALKRGIARLEGIATDEIDAAARSFV